jgi:hypothetical protein
MLPGCALALQLAAPALAAPPPAPAAEALAVLDVPDVPDGKRSYAQSAFVKIRPGYSLGGPEELPPPGDTGGELAHRRDILVQRHYAHMAELDAISDAAMRAHDVAAAERAEALRRRDTQHFLLMMQSLRRLLLKQQAEMGP